MKHSVRVYQGRFSLRVEIMRNIVYLLESTRSKICEFPRVHVGITNYLHRQILIHNHRWNPSEKERRRPPNKYTQKKLGWEPLAVISGFPNEGLAQDFYDLFKDTYDDMPPVERLWNPKYRYEINQPNYRMQQLGHTAKKFMDDILVKSIELRKSGDSGANFYEDIKLKIHWKNLSKVDELKIHLPDGVENVDGIDIHAIDKENFDINDVDDDRNYFRLKKERIEAQRRQKLLDLSKELGIPTEQVQDVLHKSRHVAHEYLTSRSGKAGKKAHKYITIHEDSELRKIEMHTGEEKYVEKGSQ